MADGLGTFPPPYASNDPLRPTLPQGPGPTHRPHSPGLSSDDRVIPSYEHAVGEVENLQCPSATQHFEGRPPPRRLLREGFGWHTLYLDQQSQANAVNHIPLCWRTSPSGVTRADMSTFANHLFPERPASRVHVRGQMCEAVQINPESWFQRKGRLESAVAEWNEGFFGPRGLQINLLLEDDGRTHNLPSDGACAECAAASQLDLGDTSGRQSNPQSRGVSRALKSLALPARRTTSSRPCCLGLLAGLAAQTVAHYAERRARGGCGERCGRRQRKGCRSHRRHCGQNASDLILPKTHPMEAYPDAAGVSAFPRSTSAVNPVHDSLPRHIDHHDASALPELMAKMGLSTTGEGTRHLQQKDKDKTDKPLGTGLALHNLRTNLAALKSPYNPAVTPSTPQRLVFPTPIKTLKREIKAKVLQIKDERREEARGRGEGCCGVAMSRQEK